MVNMADVARLAGVRRVVGHVQEIWTRADQAALTLPAWCCRQLVAISSASAASLPRVLTGRTTVVPNGSPDPGPLVPLSGRTGELRYVVASRWNGSKGHRTLLAAWDEVGIERMAQVDLGERRNYHQPLDQLGPMAESVLGVVLERLRAEGRLT